MGVSDLTVFKASPAPLKMAGWLQNTLSPVIKACRLAGPTPAVELRPMTKSGYASRRGETDRRIALNSRAVYWSKNRIAYVAVHEIAHRLVMDWEKTQMMGWNTDNHGPIFFLTVATLYKRADNIKTEDYSLFLELDLYDFQDEPNLCKGWGKHEWMPEVLGWVLSHVEELAGSELSAEELPKKAAELWIDHAKKKNVKRATLTSQKQQIEALEISLADAHQEKKFLYLWLASGWFFALFSSASLAYIVL